MHERSLVQTLIEQIDDELRQRGLKHLEEVRLEVGEFAGVEPQLMQLAFADLATDHWSQPVRLVWETKPLTARCQNCFQEFRVVRFRFRCPLCDHRQVEIVGGEGIRLVSLRAEKTSD